MGKAIPVGKFMSPQWFDDMIQIEPVGSAKFSATLNNGHWIPFTILYDETEIRITTTPEGKGNSGLVRVKDCHAKLHRQSATSGVNQ